MAIEIIELDEQTYSRAEVERFLDEIRDEALATMNVRVKGLQRLIAKKDVTIKTLQRELDKFAQPWNRR